MAATTLRWFLIQASLVIWACGYQFELPISPSSSSPSSSPVSAMYVLGDSSVDCGDNSPFYPLLHFNLSLLPCSASDSTLLPLLLAKKIGLPEIKPFYSQNGSIEGLLSGVNFGSAQASIMYPSSSSYQSLNQQLRQVFETIQLLQLQLGQELTSDLIQSSLFYLSFGKDDLISRLFSDPSGKILLQNDQNFTQNLVGQMVNTVRELYDANVRKVICIGILPLGCAPRILWSSGSTLGDGRGCQDLVNLSVLDYNRRLEEKLLELNQELPGINVIFCDVYRVITECIANPQAYGFEDVKNACCGLGEYGGMTGCVSMDMACDRASTHVWWDLYNPTEAVNSLLADSAWSGHPLPDICRPLSVHQLLSS